MILKLFYKLVVYFIKKANALKYHIDLKIEKQKWDFYFKRNDTITYILENQCEIILNRHSRLTEFILFKNFEINELKFLEYILNEGDIFIDIGANIGLHTIYSANKVGELGKVYAFEPTPSTFLKLKDNIELNHFKNVELINIGISDEQKILKINTTENYDAWNTFAEPGKMACPDLFINKVDVEVKPLDLWINENKIDTSQIKLIKIDVEGWEKFVLLGAKEILTSNYSPTILIEFDENNTWAAGYYCQELYDLLTGFGYKIYSFQMEKMKLQPEPKKLHYPSQNLIAMKNYD
jgi:FkbM family methyltransferase